VSTEVDESFEEGDYSPQVYPLSAQGSWQEEGQKLVMERLGIELSLRLVEKLKNEVPSVSRKAESSEDGELLSVGHGSNEGLSQEMYRVGLDTRLLIFIVEGNVVSTIQLIVRNEWQQMSFEELRMQQ
jgi:hypothetical protein